MSYEQSESIKELTAALIAFHKGIGKVKKDSSNPFFKSKYASLSNILDTVEQPLVENGLTVVQLPSGENILTTQLMHSSGEWIRSDFPLAPKEVNNPQATGSAITYARRYALASVLSLNIDEDDDGNAASAPPAKPPYKVPPPMPINVKTVVIEVVDIDTDLVTVASGTELWCPAYLLPKIEVGKTYKVTVVPDKEHKSKDSVSITSVILL